MKVQTTCPWCKKTQEIEVSDAGYKAWRHGKLVQDAFPELTSDQREALITGICPPCWEKAFARG